MGASESVTIQRRKLQSPKRNQKSDNNCREGESNSLTRKSEQINELLFLFLTVWGWKIPELQELPVYKHFRTCLKGEGSFKCLLLSIMQLWVTQCYSVFLSLQASQSCVHAWLSEWYRSRAKCHATVLNLVVPKTQLCWWGNQHNDVLCHFLESFLKD